MSSYKFHVDDGNITLQVNWSGASSFTCVGNPGSDNINASGTAPYHDEAGIAEYDNATAVLTFHDGSYFKVRVLFSDRANDGSHGYQIFGHKGDVITAYRGPGADEHEWYNCGNVATGAKAV